MSSHSTRSLAASFVLVGAALAACSGGGGTGAASRAAIPGATGTPAATSGNGLSGPTAKVSFSLPRHNANWQASLAGELHRKSVMSTRSPKYVDPNTEGVQVTVTGGGTTKIVYADATNAAICPPTSTSSATCTISVPVVAASETLTVDAVDVTPNDSGTNGNPAGYGDGFTGAHVLSDGTTTATLTAGTNTAIALQLGQVVSSLDELGELSRSNQAAIDEEAADEAPATAASTHGASMPRIVFSTGVAGWVQNIVALTDWDNNPAEYASPAPAFVDVNGSPQPVVATSQLQHVTVSTNAVGATAAPPFPTPGPVGSSSVSFGDQSSEWLFGLATVLNVIYDGSPSANGTITFTNGLSATDPFGNPPYTFSAPYTVAFVSASPTTLALSLSGTTSATVTGSDFQAAADGMAAFSQCVDSNGDQLASVTSNGAINPTTWQQTFTVTATAGTGNCSFTLEDVQTEAELGSSGVLSQPINVTIGS
ncbi:MAG: hypothetical protein ABR975_06325 [Vulcanimicrobiaceae bacterium]|jgi:hypothetical protein